jgi:PAS domain S-box-containing protein
MKQQIDAGSGPGEEQFRLLVSSVADYAIFLLDPAGHVASWNAGAQRIKGYAPGEIVGRHFCAFYTDEDRAAGVPQEGLRRAQHEGRFEHEGWRLRKDGSRFFAQVVITALRGPSGALRGFAKVTRDITERRRDEERLKEAAANLQALTRRLVDAEEAERRRIARELHDRVGQNLSALNINLDIALGVLDEPLSEDSRAAARTRLTDSLALVDGTLQTIEDVMAELRPPLLDEYGLGAALGWYAGEYSKRTGIRVEVHDPDELALKLRLETAVALFRIAQEALNNVAKHSQASNARISIHYEAGELVLAISDDGDGFDAARVAPTRWGVTTMRERIASVGGRLDIESAPGSGTTVRACIPDPA